MHDPRADLKERLKRAFDAVEPGADPILRPSDRADFQVNGALALAKRSGRDPRTVAAEVLDAADLSQVCRETEISGPGFINLTLSEEYLAQRIAEMAAHDRLGIEQASEPETVVLDYSAPNIAKEMHVGHLRSTVIGDAIGRVLELLGHQVIRENHVGDWGTPFGMLIEHLVDLGAPATAADLSVTDLNGFYREARASFDVDPAFADRSRHRVVLLQGGDPETMRLWRILVAESLRHFDEIYRRLGVLLTDADVVGESFYQPMLASVVEDLQAAGLLVEDHGARCVFPPGFTNRDGQPLPLIIQKSDGGFGYAATDLAAIRDRVMRLGADRILYVVGAPQSQHLLMCFAVARMAGWLPDTVGVEHVSFGQVLGPDRRQFASRSGEVVRLVDLVDEAEERGRAAVAGHNPDLDPSRCAALGRVVGVGALKYADLSSDRQKDYVFDWARLLAFEGDTGPYLQYAHARICSIFRRAPAPVPASVLRAAPTIGQPEERMLALRLLDLHDALRATEEALAPNRLGAYLFGLASDFTAFYEHCPVLRAPDDRTRTSRLALADLTRRVLATGLGLLGIEAPEQM